MPEDDVCLREARFTVLFLKLTNSNVACVGASGHEAQLHPHLSTSPAPKSTVKRKRVPPTIAIPTFRLTEHHVMKGILSGKFLLHSVFLVNVAVLMTQVCQPNVNI